MSQHARNAVGCRGDETFEGFGGFSNNPRARRARKTKNATGHLGLFSTAVGRDTVNERGLVFRRGSRSRSGLVAGRTEGIARDHHAVLVLQSQYGRAGHVRRPADQGEARKRRQHGGTGKRERGDFSNLGDARGDVCRAIDATRGPRVGPVGAAGHTRQRVGSRRWDRTRATRRETAFGRVGHHCVCVIGPGATLKGRPWPFAPTCAVGPLWLAYCASYAGSTPAGTTPGPMDGLWETRTGIISPIRRTRVESVVAARRGTATFGPRARHRYRMLRRKKTKRRRRKPSLESRGRSVVARAARPPGAPDSAMGVGEEALGRTSPPRGGR